MNLEKDNYLEDTTSRTKRSRNLKNLFLDPNNYRFADNANYVFIEPEMVLDSKVQQRTRNFISGKNREGVKDLLDSFKSNGFLEVDMIQLKRISDNNYLVLEGNRRVTALKILQEDFKAGIDIGKFDTSIFTSVPSFIHEDEDDSTHRIIMGLKHISGNKKWPAINQAKLIYDYLNPHWGKETYYKEEINLCESLGITKTKLKTSQRAYHLILQYKNSDFGDQFDSDMYYTFAEIIKKPKIKSWIEWNDYTYSADNEENALRLFSWLSNREENEEIEDEEIEDSKKFPPIITKYREIQDLAKFIDNEQALEVMEEEGSVAQGLVASGSQEQESYEKSLKALDENIMNIDRLKDLLSLEDLETLQEINKKFTSLLPKESLLDIQNESASLAFGKSTVTHFSDLTIHAYKIFNEFKIDNLNRINLFAGFNNSGKTTLLEAVYILSKQNNLGGFFELIRLKNKLEKLSSYYLNEYFQEDIKISGNFNNMSVTSEINKIKDADIDKKDDYLASYKINVTSDGEHLESIIHTFKNNPLQRYFNRIEVLCNTFLKSPYFYNQKEIINSHNKNVEYKSFHTIVDFIKEHIDPTINNIEFTEKNGIKRFLIDSSLFPERSIDITNYGEGLQRIFELALSFAYCKNGVLLVDELETAIHYSLLKNFTTFIQKLAEEFNVQVFITSHSKECIDAFINNGFHNNSISAYFLNNQDNVIKATYITGGKLQEYIEKLDFDLRGKNDG